MSAETGSGIGMGGVTGGRGIASRGGGIGLEGDLIGIGSIGASPSIGTAEIGISPSLAGVFSEVTSPASPFAGSEILSLSHNPFSMDTSMPGIEAPFQASGYQTLWSANTQVEPSLALTFDGPFDNTNTLSDVTVSEAENVNSMFADIENFLHQGSTPVTDTTESVFTDIDRFLHQDAPLSSEPDVSIDKTQNSQDATLSPTEEASLRDLMARIEHFSPEEQQVASIEPEPDVFVDSTAPYDVSNKVVGDALADFVPAIQEKQEITFAPATIVDKEIEADAQQATRVLGIIKQLEQELNKEDTVALEEISANIAGNVINQTTEKTLPTKTETRVESPIEEAIVQTEQQLKEGVAVAVEEEQETQVATATDGEGTTGVKVEIPGEEKPEEQFPESKGKIEYVHDQVKNQYRTDKIVEAVEDVRDDAEQRLAEQGIVNDVTEIEGDDVADRLSYLQTDEKAISEIVPKDEKDGSIGVLLHDVRDETFHVNAEYDKAQVLSVKNTAVKIGAKPPATEPEIEKVLFIAKNAQ